MSLRALDLFAVNVPLKKPIRHASHERSSSDNLIVRVTLDTGEVGFGEGVPRDYVTGETIASTFTALTSLDLPRLIGTPTGISQVLAILGSFSLPSIEDDPRGMNGNAARCALELALLDAFGRKFDLSLSEMLPHAISSSGLQSVKSVSPKHVRYSGAITADNERKEWISAWKMRLNQFAQVKIKVGVSGQDDPKRLERMRRVLGRGMDIRLDANESWTASEVVERAGALRKFLPTALEQPVAHAEIDLLADLRAEIGIPVMLDESLCGFPDGERAVKHRLADLFNVRLSKCGGIFPTLRLINLAIRSGLGVQLGCHPGETGILSASGRHLASCLDVFRYVEGSYDRHVLSRNLTIEDPTFGFGGWARPVVGPGLGVNVDPQALAALTVDRREIRYD